MMPKKRRAHRLQTQDSAEGADVKLASFVQSIGVLGALAATSGCATHPLFYAPANPEPVHVELRDSPAEVELFAFDAVHQHRRRPNTIDGPIYCTSSPCDATVMGGTLLRAGSPGFLSRAFQLPAKGTVRVTVDPGSGLGVGLGTVGLLAGTIGTFVGGGLVGAGVVDGCNCAHYDSGKSEIIAGSVTIGVSLALAAASYWALKRSLTTVRVEPVVRF
jgi:hypothetical protein